MDLDEIEPFAEYRKDVDKDIDIIRFRLLPEIRADTPEAKNTFVFLNGEYQLYCVYANAKKGFIERARLKNLKETYIEKLHGCVLILHCEGI